ncbi:MAG: site-2 protease family protein [Thermoproteota archaeon]|nr:site-2 protease family protein [Candidatus Brockarchaeota archaeon]
MENNTVSQFETIMKKYDFEIERVELNPYYISFIIKDKKENKENFIKLCNDLKMENKLPFMRKRKDGKIAVSIVEISMPRKRNDLKIMMVLLLATVLTVSLDFFQRYNGIVILNKLIGRQSSFLIDFLEYTLAFLLIFGLHEIGHKIMATLYNIPTRGPFFIPGIPGLIPTFGAVIFQEGIPRNRDELFDIGFSGPFFGFISAVAITVFAVREAVPIRIGEFQSLLQTSGFIEMQPIVNLVAQMIKPVGNGYTLIMGLLGFPVWLAFLVTFINMFPAAQLDGGHMARAVFGEKGHKILTIISLLLYTLMGFWLMALFVALTWKFEGHPGPLDDVSEVSTATKIKAIIGLAMFLLSATIIPLTF